MFYILYQTRNIAFHIDHFRHGRSENMPDRRLYLQKSGILILYMGLFGVFYDTGLAWGGLAD